MVALSHYRARLGRGRKLRRADALLEAPDLKAAVRALPGDELYYVLHEIGLEEGADILAAATPEQLTVALDFAVWRRDRIDGRRCRRMAGRDRRRRRTSGSATGWRGSTASSWASSSGAARHVYDLTQEEPPDEPTGRSYHDARRVLPAGRRRRQRRPGLTAGADDPRRARRRGRRRRGRSRARLHPADRRVLPHATRTPRAGCWSARAARWTPSSRRRPTAGDRRGWPTSASPTTTRRWRSTASWTRRRCGSTTAPRRARARTGAMRPRCGCRRRWPSGWATPKVRRSRAPRRSWPAREDVDDLRFALVTLTNRVMAADRVQPGDDDAVAAVLDRLLATLDLAVERLARDDDERGAAALRIDPAGAAVPVGRQPHRQGQAARRRRCAAKVRSARAACSLAEPDDATVLEAVTRLRPLYPRAARRSACRGRAPVPQPGRSGAGGRGPGTGRGGAGDGQRPRRHAGGRRARAAPCWRRPRRTRPGWTSASSRARCWSRGCSSRATPPAAVRPRAVAPAQAGRGHGVRGPAERRGKDGRPRAARGARARRPRAVAERRPRRRWPRPPRRWRRAGSPRWRRSSPCWCWRPARSR